MPIVQAQGGVDLWRSCLGAAAAADAPRPAPRAGPGPAPGPPRDGAGSWLDGVRSEASQASSSNRCGLGRRHRGDQLEHRAEAGLVVVGRLGRRAQAPAGAWSGRAVRSGRRSWFPLVLAGLRSDENRTRVDEVGVGTDRQRGWSATSCGQAWAICRARRLEVRERARRSRHSESPRWTTTTRSAARGGAATHGQASAAPKAVGGELVRESLRESAAGCPQSRSSSTVGAGGAARRRRVGRRRPTTTAVPRAAWASPRAGRPERPAPAAPARAGCRPAQPPRAPSTSSSQPAAAQASSAEDRQQRAEGVGRRGGRDDRRGTAHAAATRTGSRMSRFAAVASMLPPIPTFACVCLCMTCRSIRSSDLAGSVR